MILGIDPSYSGTGIALLDNSGKVILTKKVSQKGVCYESITLNHDACEFISDSILEVVESTDSVDVICEYPAFATKSGAYLAVLNGFLSATLRANQKVNSITWVGPKHCDSFIGNKDHSKTFIVNFCKEKNWISKRTSHDECTAIILGNLLISIWNKKWKHSYFTWNR